MDKMEVEYEQVCREKSLIEKRMATNETNKEVQNMHLLKINKYIPKMEYFIFAGNDVMHNQVWTYENFQDTTCEKHTPIGRVFCELLGIEN